MSKWIALAAVVGALTWMACVVWHNEARDARDARALDASQERLTDRINAMTDGRPYDVAIPADEPLPLPARSPVVSALVAFVAVVILGPALSLLFAAENRRR